MKTLIVAFLLSLSSLFAQVMIVSAAPPTTIAGCGTPTPPVTGFCVYGPAGGPFQLAINGGAGWQTIGTGVTSFNGQTGPVTSSTAGINYSDLINPPTQVICPVMAITNTNLSVSSCTIKH